MVILSHLPGLCPEDYHRIYLSLYTIDSLALPTDLLDLVLLCNIALFIFSYLACWQYLRRQCHGLHCIQVEYSLHEIELNISY